ncbi:MAG TPA: amidase family protein, partial [Bacillota bacterium]|nr:amidase family protein [Bacillota bacterium]
MELDKMTAAAAAKAVNNREISARELTEAYLNRCTTLNSTLHSLVHIFEQEALRQAEAVDSLVSRGETALPLAGVPVVLKDDLCYSAGPTTW